MRPWEGALTTGALTEAEVAMLFVTSPEYAALHPGSQSYVEGLYDDVLGRHGVYTPAEVSAWTAMLDQGVFSRPTVAAALLNSTEAQDNGFEALYTTFLRRPGSMAEVQAWLAATASGQLSDNAVAALFLSSPEYLNLAGAV